MIFCAKVTIPCQLRIPVGRMGFRFVRTGVEYLQVGKRWVGGWGRKIPISQFIHRFVLGLNGRGIRRHNNRKASFAFIVFNILVEGVKRWVGAWLGKSSVCSDGSFTVAISYALYLVWLNHS